MPWTHAIFTCLLATLTLARPTSISSRDEIVTSQTEISDIGGIDAGVQSLRSHVAAYQGDPLTETPLLVDFTTITLANRKGFLDANLRLSPFDASDSTEIVQFTIDTVGNDIPAAVEETKAKKPLFDKTGQSPLIAFTLETLLYEHDTFSAALEAKLSADMERAQAVVAKIHNSIQSGIDYFSA